MGIVKRQPGDRRWVKVAEFPMTDSDGVQVLRNRRCRDERRKSIATMEDLLILFSQAPSIDPGRNQ